jgi:hypothetical protein
MTPRKIILFTVLHSPCKLGNLLRIEEGLRQSNPGETVPYKTPFANCSDNPPLDTSGNR